MNTPQLKGTATHFIEVYKAWDGSVFNSLKPYPLFSMAEILETGNRAGFKTIAVWHITPHPFIDINKFKK